jgi:hypothetical protein
VRDQVSHPYKTTGNMQPSAYELEEKIILNELEMLEKKTEDGVFLWINCSVTERCVDKLRCD